MYATHACTNSFPYTTQNLKAWYTGRGGTECSFFIARKCTGPWVCCS